MSTVKAKIERLASEFATGLLDAMKGASLQELMEIEPANATAPRAKALGIAKRALAQHASPEEQTAAILALVRYAGKLGVRQEEIRKTLGCEKRVTVGVLARALKDGTIRKTGRLRGTRYFAAKP